ncbi:hypothetical protein [Streptomyces purpureus]|uniref:Lipoprotein n=1 Tax=Streptomyces purpureus TaxID=1951 RepID=A0A918LSZ4_9ACTN|nr:hypothetical protein [Streptomyces purpureus]GGT48354.1 hypothetical protein GCM10014713_48380 [Streptomyces purpureus]
MRRRHTALAGAGALLLTATLTACGIQGSDVIEAGGAATIDVSPQHRQRVLLFFVGQDGRVLPVARARENLFGDPLGRIEHDQPPPTDWPREDPAAGWGTSDPWTDQDLPRLGTDKTLALLMYGPRKAERAVGLGTRLPDPDKQAFQVSHQEGATAEPGAPRRVWIRTSLTVTELDWAAVQQIVCTAVYAEDPSGEVEVVLRGPDGERDPARCE